MSAIITINIPDIEYVVETGEELRIESIPGGTFRFEHSLRAIAEWEAAHKKVFLSKHKKSQKESTHYFQLMCVDDGLVEDHITGEVSQLLTDYIEDERTATTIKSDGGNSSKLISSELLYGYMVLANIPFEAQDWHINRLMTLIAIVGELQAPKKKMTTQEIIQQNARLNAERKKRLNTKG